MKALLTALMVSCCDDPNKCETTAVEAIFTKPAEDSEYVQIFYLRKYLDQDGDSQRFC